MNLRLSANEVRVRMDRREAEALVRGERLEEEIAFPGGMRFRYEVHPTRDATPPHAALRGAAVSVTVSTDAMRALLAQPPSRDLGLCADLATAGGAPLKLTVEIDLFSDGKGPRRK